MLVVEVPQDLIASSASNVQASKDESVQNTGKQSNSFQADPIGLETSALTKCCQMKHGTDKDVKSVRLDISFKSPSHTGLQTTELVSFSRIFSCSGHDMGIISRISIFCADLIQLFIQVKELTEQFPAAIPLALVLKKFLADRSLDQSYSGGLSSYCLVSAWLLILHCSRTLQVP